jgi:uncharacterized OB-fold protein
MTATPRKIPSPEINPETNEYWSAIQNRKLLLKRCADCNSFHYYPRALCPECFSDRTEWVETKGRGTIYSFSIMRRVPQPYAIAYVKLDEGVAMMTNIVDCDLNSIKIGDPVRVTFQPSENGQLVPMFSPQ